MQPPNVYSSHHRFRDVRGRGDLLRARGRQPPREDPAALPEGAPGVMRHLAARADRGQDDRRKNQDEKREVVPRAARPGGHPAARRRSRTAAAIETVPAAGGLAGSTAVPVRAAGSPSSRQGHPVRRSAVSSRTPGGPSAAAVPREERTMATCRCQVRGQVAPRFRVCSTRIRTASGRSLVGTLIKVEFSPQCVARLCRELRSMSSWWWPAVRWDGG
jgi:hypothetical protein